MSTRANVIIKDKHGQLIFYRHSDGYPEGVLPTLNKFMDWVKTGKIRDNVSQAAGWLIMVGAQEYDTIYVSLGDRRQKTTLTEPNAEDRMSGWKVGSYEPTTSIHGDIEYLYTLDLAAKTILVQEAFGDNQYRTINPVTNEPATPAPTPKQSRFEGVVV